MAKHPSSVVNTIHESGSKAEAVEWLQKFWDELCDAREALKLIADGDNDPRKVAREALSPVSIRDREGN